MKLQLTYHIAGTNSVHTPVDYVVTAKIDTTISNSLPFNTTCALNNFLKPIEVSKIIDELEYILRNKKLGIKTINIITKNVGMYIITISVKLLAN